MRQDGLDEQGEAEYEEPEVVDAGEEEKEGANPPPKSPLKEENGDPEAGAESESSESAGEKDEFILVKLADIRKEVQCPICLGIIRKTRTVMECLHRFCRDCIDKSMRLGNNECPACRTHCASRRSLRDDPNFDGLISALYPDIDKYEEEELAITEEDEARNEKIQASIAETIRRQLEALGKRKTNRRTRGQVRTRGRGRPPGSSSAFAASDDEEEDGLGNDGSKESSSGDERSPEVRHKRGRRWSLSRSSPARAAVNTDTRGNENDDVVAPKESFTSSPLRAGNREMPIWGKNGMRSQTRHGNSSSASVRMSRVTRLNKFAEHLRTLNEADDQFYVHVRLLPVDAATACTPTSEKLHLCCRPTANIKHLCQLVSVNMSNRTEEVEIFAKVDSNCEASSPTYALEGLRKIEEDKLLSELYAPTAFGKAYLELAYAIGKPT